MHNHSYSSGTSSSYRCQVIAHRRVNTPTPFALVLTSKPDSTDPLQHSLYHNFSLVSFTSSSTPESPFQPFKAHSDELSVPSPMIAVRLRLQSPSLHLTRNAERPQKWYKVINTPSCIIANWIFSLGPGGRWFR
jgi:hypothetical protein